MDHLKRDNAGVIDLNKLLKISWAMCNTCRTMPQQRSYFRRQRVLTALFKDRRKVESLLMERVRCFEKEQKVLFGERFQKKVNVTIKLKKNTKELLKEYTKSTPAKRPYHDVSPQPPF